METQIDIRVIPKSSQNKVVMQDCNTLKVYLHAPPIDGQANKACIQLLSKTFGIPKSSISIIKGEKGRDKRILLEGISQEKITTILQSKTG